MLIVKIVGIAYITLFIILLFRHSKSELNTLLSLTAGALILLIMIEPLKEIIDFLRQIADKANIDTVYIGIVLKILAIAYIASFSSALCKDANADSLAAQIDLSGKIMILVLAIPILMAVLNSILQIM
jgi:stage III sporulation protein AD